MGPAQEMFFGGVTFCLMCLGIGSMVAIFRWSAWRFNPKRQTSWAESRLTPASQEDRIKALETYRQLASEKMDVVKTAIAMGYSDKELSKLDKRLEELIGADALKAVMRGETPLPSGELQQRDLESELRRMRSSIEA